MRAARTLSFAALIILLLLSSCEELIVSPEGPGLNMEDFEAAWARVDAVYPYLEYKGIDWDSIYLIYQPMAASARGDEIFPLLTDMLGELRDRHCYVKTEGGGYISTYSPPRWLRDRYAYHPLVVSSYFDEELIVADGGMISWGIMEGNIGYIYLGTFDGDHAALHFPEALSHVRHSGGLILDIRHNNGGSYQNLVAVVSRFISGPLEKPDFYVLGERIPLEPFVPEGEFQYLGPVVVLINGVCYSTGDIFPEVMKQVPTVTVVGDTTSGGSAGSTSAAPAEYSLPSGKRIFVGTTDWRRYDGQPYKWIGVSPDILVRQSAADLANGRDLQLEYAIQMLR